MITITSNKYELLKKIFIQIFVLVFISAFLGSALVFGKVDTLLMLFFIFFLLLFVFINVQLFYTPIGVTIDENQKTFLVRFFLIRTPQIINLDEIENFSTTKLTVKTSSYDGIIIRLKSNKLLLLSDCGLNNFKPILSFLEQYNIQNIGWEKYKTIKYYKNCI